MGKNSQEIRAILSGEMPHFFRTSDFAKVEEGSPAFGLCLLGSVRQSMLAASTAIIFTFHQKLKVYNSL